MKFTNTSDFNIKIKGYKFDVLLDGKVIAKAEDNTVYNIPAKQSVIIPFIGNADANLSITLGIIFFDRKFYRFYSKYGYIKRYN